MGRNVFVVVVGVLAPKLQRRRVSLFDPCADSPEDSGFLVSLPLQSRYTLILDSKSWQQLMPATEPYLGIPTTRPRDSRSPYVSNNIYLKPLHLHDFKGYSSITPALGVQSTYDRVCRASELGIVVRNYGVE